MPSTQRRCISRRSGSGEFTRDQQVAVRTERLVGLLQLQNLADVLLPAPEIEIAEEPARLHGLARPPTDGCVSRSSSASRVIGKNFSRTSGASISASTATTFGSGTACPTSAAAQCALPPSRLQQSPFPSPLCILPGCTRGPTSSCLCSRFRAARGALSIPDPIEPLNHGSAVAKEPFRRSGYQWGMKNGSKQKSRFREVGTGSP